MMNRLRLHESFNLNEYEQITGLSVETVLPNLMIAKQKDLMIENTDGTWQVSKLGHRYLNDLLEMFL
jgi:oxygen-independent coproporphyrinogen-3 oxidase